jgi:RNA polymerase sigma-70 factor, ECF subfamily
MAERLRQLDASRLGDHIDRLYASAWGLCGNREWAEDLVQETYARVLARPRLLRSDDDLGYLLRVLRNTFFLQLKKEKRQPRGEIIGTDYEPVDVAGRRNPQHAAETQALYAAIAQLPEDFRLTLVAIDVAGLSYKEAAKALGTREGTVRSRLLRARGKVAELLDGPAPTEARKRSAGSVSN